MSTQASSGRIWLALAATALLAWSATARPEEKPDRPPHWSFVPPQRHTPPSVRNTNSVRSPIDQFVLAQLDNRGIAPAPEADHLTLIRRLSLDLLGLAPTIAELDEFQNDKRDDAYERLVDRLLASPHFGERWGRHWLDAARYADSNGFNIDAPRSIWKYRDWVIDALNRNMPFDQFTIEQIAGDMLPGSTIAQQIATGFHRNTLINQEGGIDKEQFRVESVVDRVNTTNAVWLGLTLGCAQCHDHKYDPFTQREFFQMFAFFNNADEPDIELSPPEVLAKRDAIRAQINALNKELTTYVKALDAKQEEWEKHLTPDDIEKLSLETRGALNLHPSMRDEQQKKLLFAAFRPNDVGYVQRETTINELQGRLPAVVTSMVIQERATPRETTIHIKGDFTRKGDPVTAGVPHVLHGLSSSRPDGIAPPVASGPSVASGEDGADGTAPNRLDFARWLVDPANPLTARVTVNRMWQNLFGRGLVETENDFGTQGTGPSHPELLDWLATEFVANGWDAKAMIRLIVSSATYRQSSHARLELATVDPDNRLIAHQSRLRIEGEVIRDLALEASGLLSQRIGGPSVFPPQPDGVYRFTQSDKGWKASLGEDRYRRGMYTYFWRSAPYPALTVFDAPSSTTTCTRRIRSNTPLQALTVLNDEAFFEIARSFASRVIREAPPSAPERIRFAFRVCLGREPLMREVSRLMDLITAEYVAAGSGEARDETRGGDDGEMAPWITLARVLINLDEFITRE
jgi:hypothetical protein